MFSIYIFKTIILKKWYFSQLGIISLIIIMDDIVYAKYIYIIKRKCLTCNSQSYHIYKGICVPINFSPFFFLFKGLSQSSINILTKYAAKQII